MSELSTRRLDAGITYVPIAMHLFGDDNGTNFADNNQINDALSELNFNFLPNNIQFFFSGVSFNHYPDSYFNDSAQTAEEENAFHTANGATNAINIYMSDYLDLNGNAVGGYAYVGVSGPAAQFYNRIWLDNGAAGAMSHEMGHFFGLPHTFNNSNSATVTDRELVTRIVEVPPRLSANCEDKGDYVCDTPADPYGRDDAADENCTYTGWAIDANQDTFDPGMTNIMSYYGCAPAIFTPGQRDRMAQTLSLFLAPDNGFTLTAPETDQLPPSNLFITTPDADYAGMYFLLWQDNSNVETGYLIERSTNPNGPFIPVKGVAENVTAVLVPLEPGVGNYVRVKPSNSMANYSEVIGPITPSNLCGNNFGQSCEFINTDPALAAWRIERFTLSRNNDVLIDNADSGCSLHGIGNYFSVLGAEVIPGETLSFNVQSKMGTDGAYDIHAQLFADWNDDNDFEDADEMLFVNGSDWFEVSGTFTVPAGLANGEYRLRVAVTADQTTDSMACGYFFGEVEDYKLSIGGLSTGHFAETTFYAYPNPAGNLLHFRYSPNLTIDRLTITDVSGKNAFDGSFDGAPVDVSRLSPGMYLVKAVSGQGVFSAKFIKE